MAETKSNSTFLVVTIVLGLVATALAFVFLSNARPPQQTEMDKIWVARRAIKTNDTINLDRDVELLAIPRKEEFAKLRNLAFTESNPPPARERVNRNIFAGSPILRTDIGGLTDLEIKEPNRALSIPARGANAVSGLLVPGDHVELWVTRPIAGAHAIAPPTATAPVETVIPTAAKIGMGGERSSVHRSFKLCGGARIRVLAVGTQLARMRAQMTVAEQYQAAAEAQNLQTVTLEVNDAQAQEILEQTAGGTQPVTLLLCPAKPVKDVKN